MIIIRIWKINLTPPGEFDKIIPAAKKSGKYYTMNLTKIHGAFGASSNQPKSVRMRIILISEREW